MISERRSFLRAVTGSCVGLLAIGRRHESRAATLPSEARPQSGKATQPGVLELPAFEKTNPFPLDRALLQRRSGRSYDASRPLSREEISRLLWACNGVNREDGRRTVPSAKAKYPVDVVAALPEGTFRYDPRNHQLVPLILADIRSKIPVQEGFKAAGMTVLYVIDTDRLPDGRTEWADVEIGCMGQNLFLEAAALGLGACIFAYVQTDVVSKALGLKTSQVLRLAQSVGRTS